MLRKLLACLAVISTSLLAGCRHDTDSVTPTASVSAAPTQSCAQIVTTMPTAKVGTDGTVVLHGTACLSEGRYIWAAIPDGDFYDLDGYEPLAYVSESWTATVSVGHSTSIIFLQGDDTCRDYLKGAPRIGGFYRVEHDKALVAHGCAPAGAPVSLVR